jgi:hypothetical protein
VELLPETFSGRVGDRFSAAPTVSGAPFELVLTSCDVSSDTIDGRVPFSLIFHADTSEHVGQQIVSLSHDDLGEVALFIVPLGPQQGRMSYQVVIS